jgi:hypothetical protein
MKLIRSRISLVLVIVMMFTLFGSNTVLAATVDYSTSLASMHELGIIDSSATNVNSVVTRAAFLKSIIEAEGLDAAAANSKGTTPFSDITQNSTLSGYINAGLNIGTTQGVNEGVVYGTADGTYRPNDAVTYAEACTIMVRLLGYSDTDSVLENSSWPNNYIQEAATLKLTTGISLSKSSKLTVGVEAVLFDRLFNSVMKSSTSSSEKYFSDNYYADSTVTGTLTEAIIVGNSKTSDDLSDNQILAYTAAGKETLTLQNGVTAPTIGAKYKLYVYNSTTVTKVAAKENTVEDYAVTAVSSSSKLISYTDSNKKTQTLTLPQASAYYYHGKYVDYDTVIKSIQSYSSVILAKNSSGSGYEYGIIVDPEYDRPYVYKYDNVELLNKLNATTYDYIYREDSSYASKTGNITKSDLNAYDVVYFVSDIWNRHTFVYVYDKVVYGTITAFVPDKVSPTGLTLSSTYSFSSYFDKSKLSTTGNSLANTSIGDFRALVLGLDGTIVDLYAMS